MTREQVVQMIRQRAAGRTQREMAHELGVGQQHLNDIFGGRREPGPTILLALGLRKISYFVRITAGGD
jgi:DNA-binding XRE family transcriptional regulator